MELGFLPDKLDLDGTFEEMVALLYDVFTRDIKKRNFRYKGLRVIFDNRCIDSKYEEGFWHIITEGKVDRLLDYKRAKRLVWLRPLVENSNDSRLHKWTERDLDKKGKLVNKTYIWYREGRYLIVLKEIPGRYFLSTAFHVTGQRNDSYYLRKYNEAKKKGPGC